MVNIVGGRRRRANARWWVLEEAMPTTSTGGKARQASSPPCASFACRRQGRAWDRGHRAVPQGDACPLPPRRPGGATARAANAPWLWPREMQLGGGNCSGGVRSCFLAGLVRAARISQGVSRRDDRAFHSGAAGRAASGQVVYLRQEAESRRARGRGAPSGAGPPCTCCVTSSIGTSSPSRTRGAGAAEHRGRAGGQLSPR